MTNNIISLPQPSYSFRPMISSWSDRVVQDTRNWIHTDFAFLPRKMQMKYERSNFGKLSARCFPEMKTYEHLQVAARFMLWGTIFDDYNEFASPGELRQLHEQVMNTLSGRYPEDTTPPFLRILAEMHAVLETLMPYDWIARFAANVGTWVASMEEEVPYKQEYHFPTLAYFLDLRTRTIGVQAYLDLIEMQLPHTLPDRVMQSTYFREVYRCAARIFAFCNDFYSLQKDVNREPLNLVLVLQHEYKLSEMDAHSAAMSLHDGEVKAIMELMQCPPDFGIHNAEVMVYLDYLGVTIQGANDWYQQDTLRYKANGFPEKGSFDINQENGE